MKKLSVFNKFIFFINSILAAALLLSYTSYFISPNTLPFVSFLGLCIPFLIILNLVFAVYWILKLKKQFLLSAFTLLIGFTYLNSFYQINQKKTSLVSDVKIMSYNVRMFNVYNWIKDENIPKKIKTFINQKKPDILCIQEYHPSVLLKYPYKYVKIRDKNLFGYAILSKYKIINSGALNFSNTNNNTIFSDIVKDKDTFRVYNIHLESLKINPKDTKQFNKGNSEKLLKRVEKAFKTQENQAILIKKHVEKSPYRSIISGDFNNTAFSWIYHQLKENKNDAFEVAGKGFGKSFNYYFPFRIDFILVDEKIKIHKFNTYPLHYSDHYPIMARVQL